MASTSPNDLLETTKNIINMSNTSDSSDNTSVSSTLFPTEDPLYCHLFGGDQHKCNVIIAVKRAAGSLSLIGCVFMIFVIWLFRKYQIFAQRLILYLTVAALLDSVAYIMGDMYPPGRVCNFQAWMVTFFDWVVLLWVCCITFNLYMSVIKLTHTERFEWVYHMVSWGIPFFISFLPFINDHYGPAGLWCWIETDLKWRMGIWYAPQFIGIAGLFFVYIYIVVTVRKRSKTWEGLYDPDVERNKKILKDEVKPLTAYPFVYLAVSVFPLINRIQNAVSYEPVFGLVLLHAMTAPLQGAVNAIVFGLDRDTASRLTPSQIRMEFRQRMMRDKALIREYPSMNQEGADYQSTITNITSLSDVVC